jgi:hypothetical protein
MLYRDIISVHYGNCEAHISETACNLLFRQVEYVKTNCFQGLAWRVNRHTYFLSIMHQIQFMVYKLVTGQMSQIIWVQFLAGAEVFYLCSDWLCGLLSLTSTGHQVLFLLLKSNWGTAGLTLFTGHEGP